MAKSIPGQSSMWHLMTSEPSPNATSSPESAGGDTPFGSQGGLTTGPSGPEAPPCQPFSVAGKGAAQADERHLWPVFFELIRACRPPVVMGEQVAAAVGKSWLDGVSADLEGIGYATGAAVIPACAVDAPHRRDRLWFVADAKSEQAWRQGQSRFQPIVAQRGICDVVDAVRLGRQRPGALGGPGNTAAGDNGQASDAVNAGAGFWAEHRWAVGADGKARRVEPSIRLLVDGVPPGRVGRLRAYGNAIVPQVAAEVIRAFMEATEAT